MGFDRTHVALRAHGKHAEYAIDNRCEFGGDVHGAEKLLVQMLPHEKEETVAYGEDYDGWFACEADKLDPLPPQEAELQIRKKSMHVRSGGRKRSTARRPRRQSKRG